MEAVQSSGRRMVHAIVWRYFEPRLRGSSVSNPGSNLVRFSEFCRGSMGFQWVLFFREIFPWKLLNLFQHLPSLWSSVPVVISGSEHVENPRAFPSTWTPPTARSPLPSSGLMPSRREPPVSTGTISNLTTRILINHAPLSWPPTHQSTSRAISSSRRWWMMPSVRLIRLRLWDVLFQDMSVVNPLNSDFNKYKNFWEITVIWRWRFYSQRSDFFLKFGNSVDLS